MTNDYIVKKNLVYEFLIVKRVFFIGSSEYPQGNHFNNITLRKIFSSFVPRNNRLNTFIKMKHIFLNILYMLNETRRYLRNQ